MPPLAPCNRPGGGSFCRSMAKLYFPYSPLNAGKSTVLLQAAHNYAERGMATYLLTAQFDNRAGEGRIGAFVFREHPPL